MATLTGLPAQLADDSSEDPAWFCWSVWTVCLGVGGEEGDVGGDMLHSTVRNTYLDWICWMACFLLLFCFVDFPPFLSPLKLIRISCGKISGGTKQFSDKHILFEVSIKAVFYLNVHFCCLVWTDLFWTNRVHSTAEKRSQALSPWYNHTGWLGIKHQLLTYSQMLDNKDICASSLSSHSGTWTVKLKNKNKIIASGNVVYQYSKQFNFVCWYCQIRATLSHSTVEEIGFHHSCLIIVDFLGNFKWPEFAVVV